MYNRFISHKAVSARTALWLIDVFYGERNFLLKNNQ